jgi:hypothetical protein
MLRALCHTFQFLEDAINASGTGHKERDTVSPAFYAGVGGQGRHGDGQSALVFGQPFVFH